MRSRLRLARLDLGIHTRRVHEKCDVIGVRRRLVQQFQEFWCKLGRQPADARDGAAGPVEAGDETHLDRIGAALEDDWNRRGG